MLATLALAGQNSLNAKLETSPDTAKYFFLEYGPFTMLFDDAGKFLNSNSKAVTVFGMSGVGKSFISNLLRKENWFHYSIDYRIGSRYMGEYITDNLKREAMQVPFLRSLLRSDSIDISTNLRFENLDPLSTYLGAPGDSKMGGLDLEEYQKRQEQHRIAEIFALGDIPHFIQRAKNLFGYDNFIADTGGSMIEVLEPVATDPIVKTLTTSTMLVYIRGSDADTQSLVDRYKQSPKPMYYRPALLIKKWAQFKNLHHITRDEDVNPVSFAVWGFEEIMRDRQPRYQLLADRFGYTIDACDLSNVRDSKDFEQLLGKAISKRKSA